jgi:hypothetical protein
MTVLKPYQSNFIKLLMFSGVKVIFLPINLIAKPMIISILAITFFLSASDM